MRRYFATAAAETGRRCTRIAAPCGGTSTVPPVSNARAMDAASDSVLSALSRTCARSMKPPRHV